MATDAEPAHAPVLLEETLAGLAIRPEGMYVDGTYGRGGHARAVLARLGAGGRLVVLDRDPEAIDDAQRHLGRDPRVRIHHATFDRIAELAGRGVADGVLLDLGVSSPQLDDPARGFSFRAAGPLDMRMGPEVARTAADLVNHADEATLARVLRDYGEEPRARAVARAIVRARPLATTGELARAVARAAGRTRPGLHPATRTFQAIRIAVNDELAALDALLADGWRCLRPEGRLAVLAYHSLEDRRVKTAFRRWASSCLCPPHVPRCTCGWTAKVRLVTAKAERPDADEIAANPRARSARLRIVERLP
jgi:16S rRNA (cytosine1402-N4)-methyltransferase